MQAVRYNGPNVPFALEEVPMPVVGAGEVLVEVKAAALCHTELHFSDGTLNLGVTPITMGHEAAGVIVGAGEGVAAERVGERVVVYYYVGCGECRWCKAGEEALCDSLKAEFGFISDGGLAQFLKVPARNAVHLPDSISFEAAAPIGCGVTTAVHAARLAGVASGDWAAVYGVNGVGFGLVQLLKHRGARVIAITRSEARRAKAKELGADVVVDSSDASTVAADVRAATGGAGCDLIFECTTWLKMAPNLDADTAPEPRHSGGLGTHLRSSEGSPGGMDSA
jgi:propanol-preferring alcohol dehydrogenase